ncbi:CACTA en-spm transposon protein [Cucumis melo var. makuwa]|uniref:CACTA en-spm transposon protein n=1 Tax=Cucumis melo var. makuwa TaxID=1194695 RepID=A0A5A7VGZ0_CUCMM|nr:CACTA en-spm transposon protein [Cucumis melo var. makuwa]
MVIGESDASGSGDTNFYDVLNEVLYVQYPIGRNVWLINFGGTSQSFATPTPRRRAQSRLLEFEHYYAEMGVCAKDIYRLFLKWVNIGIEYVERFFVLDFNDQAMNRFVEHQMLSTFKEFWDDYYRHFKKYSDPKEARANPPHILSNHGPTRLLDRSSLTIIAVDRSQFYNDNMSSLSKEGSDRPCGVVLTNTRSRRNVRVASRRGCTSYPRGYSAILWGRDMRDGSTVDEAMLRTEEQIRNHDESMSQTQKGPPHDP